MFGKSNEKFVDSNFGVSDTIYALLRLYFRGTLKKDFQCVICFEAYNSCHQCVKTFKFQFGIVVLVFSVYLVFFSDG